ncbi:MAG: SH3 domain-containing protein [Alphaproteobacteria bacterium]|nr:SH3 domain-containing protein [Alphaproteobacteria bacterium]
MRLAFVAIPLTALLGVTILPVGLVDAAEGDRWTVEGQNVNVRSGPSTSTDILMTINPGENIVEIASKGEWYFVEFPDRNTRGWVFGPLLTTPDAGASTTAAAAAAAPASTATNETSAPAATSAAAAVAAETTPPEAVDQAAAVSQTAAVSVDEEPAAVKSFRDTVAELNDRAVSVAGINLFSDVRSTGGGGVQVLATETWASVPEAGQSSYMNALFDRWQSVANGLGPLSLQIVDPTGQVMMERSGS